MRFAAHYLVGIGVHGDIILQDKHSKRIIRMTYSGQKYSQTLSMESPDEDWILYKAVDVNNHTLLQVKVNSDTVCYDDAATEVYRLKHEGGLENSVDGELFYRAKTRGTDDDWQIQVHRAPTPASPSRQKGTSTRPVTLQPSAPHRWGIFLSVCLVPDGYAVTEYMTDSLDIFTTEGMIY